MNNKKYSSDQRKFLVIPKQASKGKKHYWGYPGKNYGFYTTEQDQQIGYKFYGSNYKINKHQKILPNSLNRIKQVNQSLQERYKNIQRLRTQNEKQRFYLKRKKKNPQQYNNIDYEKQKQKIILTNKQPKLCSLQQQSKKIKTLSNQVNILLPSLRKKTKDFSMNTQPCAIEKQKQKQKQTKRNRNKSLPKCKIRFSPTFISSFRNPLPHQNYYCYNYK